MQQYEVNWATGNTETIEADTPEEAYDLAKELLPRGGGWVDVNVVRAVTCTCGNNHPEGCALGRPVD